MDKKGLRRNIIKKMKSYDKVQKHLADEWLAKKLYQSEAYRKANKIGIVLSMPHEVNTYPIITYSLHNNKKILFLKQIINSKK
ncbi:5-formyltetrahydrofolate cyclo-ligase domain protein [Staphylococcus epidermidis 14.1.R1.SE]|nr:5-formyltetrahydrofolate cyclo-ligase domain protein [Staphylococcus epidermidis 14.1.R1.SE]